MAEPLEALLRACTVRVLGGPMPGAGFFVAPHIVVTCAHVIGDNAELRVRWERDWGSPVEAPVTGKIAVLDDGGRPIPALERDYPDIAVLEVAADVAGLDNHPCVLLDADWPTYDDSFQVFGYPAEGGAVQLTPARLTYRGIHGVYPTAYMDLASDTVKPGMSGAAVLNLRSRAVCGVVVASKHIAHPEGALAVPWSVIEPGIADVMTANLAFHDRDARWAASAAVHRRRQPFRLPRVVAHFTGRDDLMAELDCTLDVRLSGVITQIISGLGGVGKTQLAASFAAAHSDEFNIIAWIRADDGWVTDLADLAVFLGLPVSGRNPSERATDVLAFLSSTDRRWLLVLDNIPGPAALQELPVSGNGRILATTRHRGGYEGLGSELAVDVLGLDSAVKFLMARSGRADEKRDARAVATAVGCFPLALVHAADYCARDGGAPFSEYLGLLDSLPSQELYDSSRDDFYQQTVAVTWNTSITAAEQRAALARSAIEMTAYLAPAIPRSFFSVLDEHSAPGKKRVSDALAALHRYSLATVTDNQVSVHRLVQKVIRDQLSGQANAMAAAHSLDAVDQAWLGGTLPPTWPQWQELTSHVVAVADIEDVSGIDASRLVSVLNWTCSFLLSADQLVLAREIAARAVAISGRLLAPDHLETFTARWRLGDSYRRDMPRKAIKIFKPLAADSERILGAEHEMTLTVRDALGDTYRYAGQTAQAIKTLEPLVTDSERILGTEHDSTIAARNDLALAYLQAGRAVEAVPILEQLASYAERVYGPETPSTLTIRLNLAGAYTSTGRAAEGRAIAEQLAIDAERILGPEHRLTVAARQWI
jgi:tetratricopeptide (TPR) repeat protein